MPLNSQELLSYYDKLNNELLNVNQILKNEKDDKKSKVLLKQSELINQVLIKLNHIKNLNEQLLK
jgi:hypothetical protein